MQVYTHGLGPSLGLHRFVHAFPALMLRQPRLEESMLSQLYVLVFYGEASWVRIERLYVGSHCHPEGRIYP